MRVEVDVLGFPPLIAKIINTVVFIIFANSPHSLCGRKATLDSNSWTVCKRKFLGLKLKSLYRRRTPV